MNTTAPTDATKKIRTYRSLGRFTNQRSKNIFRGILTELKNERSPLEFVNRVRTTLDFADIATATEMLIGSEGLYPEHYIPKDYRALQSFHRLTDATSPHEVGFICGHLNGWKQDCLKLLKGMKSLTQLETLHPLEQLQIMRNFWEDWGISDFLNKKLVFYMNLIDVDKSVVAEYRAFTKLLDIESAPEPYFSVMELISERYPYFRSIRTWTDMLAKYETNDFRQHNALHNAIAVPINQADVGAYLRKSYSMSVPDELCAIKVILSLRSEWPDLTRQVEHCLNAELVGAVLDLENQAFSQSQLIAESAADDTSFLIYRRAIAFLEQSTLARYRYEIDQVLAPRVLPGRYGIDFQPARSELRREDTRQLVLSESSPVPRFELSKFEVDLDSFIRTVLFLFYVASFPQHLDFEESEIRHIFENTRSLEHLLTEGELEALYNLSQGTGRVIIATLALALYNERKHDEDIDFKFRWTFQTAVINSYSGDIIAFMKWLGSENPSIAEFLVNTLDRQTIQKLYLLVDSAERADAIRQEILRHLGESLDSLPYLVEADRIRAHNQLSKLKTDIDDSRVFIDGIGLKKWIRDNPNAYLKEYRRLIEHSIESVTRAALLISENNVAWIRAEVSVISSFDFILTKAMETVFHQFCTSHAFGIDSYLGRRIRHNTLHGMMLGGVDSIISQFPALYADVQYMRIYNTWLESYKKTIDYIRLELFQFRDEIKRRGLFLSSFDVESPATVSNIIELRKSVISSGIVDDFEDAVIRFCWDQFEPQLKKAQLYISRELRLSEIENLDSILSAENSPESRTFVAMLRASVHDRFATLSSWFQVPEDRTLSATVRQLSDLITLECEQALEQSFQRVEWGGEDADLVIRGSSVHRLYDCLFVLIYNAYRHGSRLDTICGSVLRIAERHNVQLEIRVKSYFLDPDRREEHLGRIQEVLDQASNLSTAMIKEGYSGIRKLLYLTSEGQDDQNVQVESDLNSLTLGFKTVVEVEGNVFEDIAR